ncbi:MAG: hypothetical protein IBJ03_01525 [Gemmatimonadaceae bacterium]|nr:hypothetical protein [Gemmatimonadaceae bacterium]
MLRRVASILTDADVGIRTFSSRSPYMPISIERRRGTRQTLSVISRAMLALTGVVSFPAAHVMAQPTVTADAMMASGFVWRGIHFTNRPVVQGDVYLTQTVRKATLTAGAWINAEPADYRAADAVRMLAPGHHGPALTAIAPWIDATVQTGRVSLTGGATMYRYPKKTGFAEGYNTTELYAKATAGGALAPRVQVWWDVQKVRGAYVETAIAHTFNAGIPLVSSLTAGWSAGQEARGTQTAYFVRSGLAALDGALGVPLTRGHFTISPSVHAVLANDAATQLVTPGDPMRRTKLWWSLGGTWTR